MHLTCALSVSYSKFISNRKMSKIIRPVLFVLFYCEAMRAARNSEVAVMKLSSELIPDEVTQFIADDDEQALSENPRSYESLKNFVLKSGLCKNLYQNACSKTCQHGKLKFANGCCRCVCRKGYYLPHLRSTRCYKAHWGKWGTWSKCIKSSWGGIQTKERSCLYSRGKAPGACNGQGSKSRTCSMVTGTFRIRKNIKALTDEEFHDFVQAYTKFKEDKSPTGFSGTISWHGWPGRCPWYHHIHFDNHCSWHHHPMFLPWHRLIMVNIELGMSKYLKNKTIGFPYWDWAEDRKTLPRMIASPKIYDPILKRFVNNPFIRGKIEVQIGKKLVKDSAYKYSQRGPWYPGLLMYKSLQKGSIRGLLSRVYYNFDNQIHDCFCADNTDRCTYGMPTVNYAAWDPMFAFTHSAMDRLLVMRRKLHEEKNVQDWTKDNIMEGYYRFDRRRAANNVNAWDWPMSPFTNKTLNPQTVTQHSNVGTFHRSHYHKELFGYHYDNFDLGDYKWSDLVIDYDYNTGGSYWHDYRIISVANPGIGVMTAKNCMLTTGRNGCVMKYSNPKSKITFIA